MDAAQLSLSKASGVPYYRQLRDQLDDRIRSGVLAPGSPLPSIRELAATLSVSVITVKSAYEELEAQGLIASRQGLGTFVADNAVTASRKHFEAEIGRELAALVHRAATVGIDADRVRALFEQAVRKNFAIKEGKRK